MRARAELRAGQARSSGCVPRLQRSAVAVDFSVAEAFGRLGVADDVETALVARVPQEDGAPLNQFQLQRRLRAAGACTCSRRLFHHPARRGTMADLACTSSRNRGESRARCFAGLILECAGAHVVGKQSQAAVHRVEEVKMWNCQQHAEWRVRRFASGAKQTRRRVLLAWFNVADEQRALRIKADQFSRRQTHVRHFKVARRSPGAGVADTSPLSVQGWVELLQARVAQRHKLAQIATHVRRSHLADGWQVR
jgi:hypothetical protein